MAELDDKVIVTKDKITDVADAIRYKLGEDSLYTLDDMPGKVRSIEGGGGGETIPPIIFYSDPNVEVRCTLTYEELKTLYDSEGATLPIYLITKGTYEPTKDSCFAMNQLMFYNNEFHIYFNLGSNTTSKYMRVEYTTNNLYFVSETRLIQKQLTQGTGINIASDGTISVSFAQAEGGGF